MIVNKYVSVKTVIESVYINAGYQTINWNEALEYIGRIIALLGIDTGYVDKNTDGVNGSNPIEVKDYRALLPCDLVHIHGIRDWEHKTAFIYTTDVYKLNPNPNNSDNFRSCYPENDYTQFQCLTFNDVTTDQDAMNRFFFYKEQYDNEMKLDLETKAVLENMSRMMPTYFVQNGVIFTNIKECLLEISYSAFQTDAEGYPMIPDDEYYKRAVELFIQERIDYKLWRQGKLSKDIYQHSEKEYLWAVKSAISHCNTPSVDEMETLKNSYMRLITDMRSHSSGFKYNSSRERYFGGR